MSVKLSIGKDTLRTVIVFTGVLNDFVAGRGPTFVLITLTQLRNFRKPDGRIPAPFGMFGGRIGDISEVGTGICFLRFRMTSDNFDDKSACVQKINADITTHCRDANKYKQKYHGAL